MFSFVQTGDLLEVRENIKTEKNNNNKREREREKQGMKREGMEGHINICPLRI